ncbi:MAG TPA: molecular chaperone HtpG [Thermoanaerobaculia bacterium]|nr:molecular chaperone HtpG [Thermoanaerobaculia bacterium]
MSVETHAFQAETRKLLDLMIHSLYTNKEIFLRELISNASDALDRLRFEALTRPELLEEVGELEIRIEADPEARTVTLSDNGIGMSRQEVIDNIGTIAKSGTQELMQRIRESATEKDATELIGQFGVGFYSAFMVADYVTLLTRRAGESGATLWRSSGDGTYSLAEADKDRTGTSITLRLKDVDKDNGIDDFTDEWVLSRIIKRYSDFVAYPIKVRVRREKPILDEEGKEKAGESETVLEDKVMNSMRPIWTRAQSEVSETELHQFYKHVSHDWNEPLKSMWFKAEGRVEYQALLFVPAKAPYDLFYVASRPGLQLYVKKVMIMEHCEELMPRYLRFIRGVVESPDLPLNISRETLQQDRHITQIRRWLTRKVLETFRELQTGEPEKYLELWGEFGRAVKEGVAEDFDNRDRLLELLLFQSSSDPEKLTTLKDYVGRMKEDQKEIFYLSGESRSQVESSPHLEAFREKGYEVLYLVDTVDELLMQSLTEHEGKRFKDAGKGTVELGSAEEREKKQEELKEKSERFNTLLEAMQKRLDTWVKQVRLTNRLTASPVCLVGAEHDYSPQLERLLQKGKGGGPAQRRIMELNPDHPILSRLQERFEQNQEDPVIADYAELLLGYGLLAEGAELPDPARFNRLVADLMARAA